MLESVWYDWVWQGEGEWVWSTEATGLGRCTRPGGNVEGEKRQQAAAQRLMCLVYLDYIGQLKIMMGQFSMHWREEDIFMWSFQGVAVMIFPQRFFVSLFSRAPWWYCVPVSSCMPYHIPRLHLPIPTSIPSLPPYPLPIRVRPNMCAALHWPIHLFPIL